jgi:hypothetical protein
LRVQRSALQRNAAQRKGECGTKVGGVVVLDDLASMLCCGGDLLSPARLGMRGRSFKDSLVCVHPFASAEHLERHCYRCPRRVLMHSALLRGLSRQSLRTRHGEGWACYQWTCRRPFLRVTAQGLWMTAALRQAPQVQENKTVTSADRRSSWIRKEPRNEFGRRRSDQGELAMQ